MAATTGPTVIRFDRVSVDLDRVRALDDLTFEIHRGDVLGLLGPSGSGKTVALRVLLGTVRATSGAITVFDLDAWWDGVETHCHLAYVPAHLPAWRQLTVRQILDLLGRLQGPADPAYRADLLRRFELDPDLMDRRSTAASRRQAALVVALATRADLLVFDEPTADLAPHLAARFWPCTREAAQRGQTVVVASRDLRETAPRFDRVALLRRGRLVGLSPPDDLERVSGHAG